MLLAMRYVVSRTLKRGGSQLTLNHNTDYIETLRLFGCESL
jgi:hypothetical protein